MLLPLHKVEAQWKPAEKHLDTLSVSDRLSVRTNGTDWLIMVPNVGVELDLGKLNYNRLTAALNLRWKWGTGHTFVPKMVYNVFEVKGEVRSYWRTRQVTAEDGVFPPHKHIWDKLMSLRRREPKHPVTTFYRGVWLSYATYSFDFEAIRKYGRQGSAVMGGVLYGIQRPLYRYRNGRSIDLDLGVSIGAALVKYDTYKRDVDNNRYRKVSKNPIGWKVLPVVNELRAGLVYRLGKTQGYDKYNYRYDVEQAYRAAVEEAAHEKYTIKINQEDAARRFQAVYDIYQQKLDSVLQAHPGWQKSDQQQQREKEKEIRHAEAEKKKAEKEQQRQAEVDRKAAEAERKAAEKEQRKQAEAEKKAAESEEKAVEPAENADADEKTAEPAENAESEEKAAESAENAESEEKAAEPAENAESENKAAEPAENAESEEKAAEPAEGTESEEKAAEPAENADANEKTAEPAESTEVEESNSQAGESEE